MRRRHRTTTLELHLQTHRQLGTIRPRPVARADQSLLDARPTVALAHQPAASSNRYVLSRSHHRHRHRFQKNARHRNIAACWVFTEGKQSRQHLIAPPALCAAGCTKTRSNNRIPRFDPKPRTAKVRKPAYLLLIFLTHPLPTQKKEKVCRGRSVRSWMRGYSSSFRIVHAWRIVTHDSPVRWRAPSERLERSVKGRESPQPTINLSASDTCQVVE